MNDREKLEEVAEKGFGSYFRSLFGSVITMASEAGSREQLALNVSLITIPYRLSGGADELMESIENIANIAYYLGASKARVSVTALDHLAKTQAAMDLAILDGGNDEESDEDEDSDDYDYSDEFDYESEEELCTQRKIALDYLIKHQPMVDRVKRTMTCGYENCPTCRVLDSIQVPA